jgi:hypothetical protein
MVHQSVLGDVAAVVGSLVPPVEVALRVVQVPEAAVL